MFLIKKIKFRQQIYSEKLNYLIDFSGIPLGQKRRSCKMAGETNRIRFRCSEKYRCSEKRRHYLSNSKVTRSKFDLCLKQKPTPIKINHLILLQECPEIALDAVVGLCQTLSPTSRGEVVRTLAQLALAEEQEANNSG